MSGGLWAAWDECWRPLLSTCAFSLSHPFLHDFFSKEGEVREVGLLLVPLFLARVEFRALRGIQGLALFIHVLLFSFFFKVFLSGSTLHVLNQVMTYICPKMCPTLQAQGDAGAAILLR